ncbi:hypothetical protein [Streptomyces paludis]|uniref:Uncharacterized protein n=1 Tax=Streptomyces paludis TaxID=2282738 RepID=A0A345HN17_9ACTN|nr:hypothetical protein [Streptomyces paludis]AXG78091.1 hypothetical protein DVK44_10665 [Streptomyces paludis]
MAVSLAFLWLIWVASSGQAIRTGWDGWRSLFDGFPLWGWVLALWLVVLRPFLYPRPTPGLVLPGEDLRPSGFGWRAVAFLGVMATTLLVLVVNGPLLGLAFREGTWADSIAGLGDFLASAAFLVPTALIAGFLFLSPAIWPSEAWARRVRARLAGGRPAKGKP